MSEFSERLDFTSRLAAIKPKLGEVVGELDYLQACIATEIEGLEELQNEICERAERVACAIDFNRKKDD